MHCSKKLKKLKIKLLSLHSLKKYFLFSFFFSLSSFSSFFLFSSLFFFFFCLSPSSPLCWIFIFIADLLWVCLRFVLGLSLETHLSHVAVPCRRPISLNPSSHHSSNADKPSPPSHRRSKLHQHHLHQTQECRETDQGRNEAKNSALVVLLDFVGLSGFRGSVVV